MKCYIRQSILDVCIVGVQVRNMKMVFNIIVHLASGWAMNTNDENL